MNANPKDKPANDNRDIQPLPVPDILPGDPEGLKPVQEPGFQRPQRTDVND